MKTTFSLLIGAAIFCLAIISCAGPRYLRTADTSPKGLAGDYDLYLYGHRFAADYKNIAFLMPVGGKYTFELYAPEFDYIVKKGLPAKEALAVSENFVRFHYSFKSSQLSEILDYEGNVIGYELRPLYSALDFSYSDIFETHYIIKDGKVIASVGLKPEIREKPIEPFIFTPRVR